RDAAPQPADLRRRRHHRPLHRHQTHRPADPIHPGTVLMRLPSWLAQHLAALRALLVLTVLTGVIYPVAILGVAQLPGLKQKADGSLRQAANGKTAESAIIAQSFTNDQGKPLVQYFQSRPSAAGSAGYDPTHTGASHLRPENVVEHPP